MVIWFSLGACVSMYGLTCSLYHPKGFDWWMDTILYAHKQKNWLPLMCSQECAGTLKINFGLYDILLQPYLYYSWRVCLWQNNYLDTKVFCHSCGLMKIYLGITCTSNEAKSYNANSDWYQLCLVGEVRVRGLNKFPSPYHLIVLHNPWAQLSFSLLDG